MEEHATTNMALTLAEPEEPEQGVVETPALGSFPKTFDNVYVIPCVMLIVLIVGVFALCFYQKYRRTRFDTWGK